MEKKRLPPRIGSEKRSFDELKFLKPGQCPRCSNTEDLKIIMQKPLLYECPKCGFAWVELKEEEAEEK